MFIYYFIREAKEGEIKNDADSSLTNNAENSFSMMDCDSAARWGANGSES
jgi:hypothetical protein